RISTLSSAHFEIARKIHCNPDGTVVIGGDNASDGIIILVKYDSTGVMLDSTNYDVNTSCIFFDFTVDNNGNYYVLGRIYNSSTQEDFLILKYNANLDLIWSKA